MVDPGGEQRGPEQELELGRPQRPPQPGPSELSDHHSFGVETAVLALVADHELAHLADDGVAGAAEQLEVGTADELGDHHRLDLEAETKGVPGHGEAAVRPVLCDQRAAESDDEVHEQPGVLPLFGHEQGHCGDVIGIVGAGPASP